MKIILDASKQKYSEEEFMKIVENMSIENWLEAIKDIADFSEKYKTCYTDYLTGIGIYVGWYLQYFPENTNKDELLNAIISEVKTAKPDNLYMYALLDALGDKNTENLMSYSQLSTLTDNLILSFKKCNNFDKIELTLRRLMPLLYFLKFSKSEQIELSEKIIKFLESIDFNPNKNLSIRQVDERKDKYLGKMVYYASSSTRNRYRNYYRQQFKKELDAKEANNKSKNKIIDEEDIFSGTDSFYQKRLKAYSAEDRKFVLNEYRKKNYKIKPASKDFYKVPTVEEIQKSQPVSE